MSDEVKVNSKARLIGKILNGLFIALLVILCFALIMTSFFSLCKVDGTSMNDTLADGQYVLIDKSNDVSVGDVIVFDLGDNSYIKRVIATGGDTIRFASNGINDDGDTIVVTELYSETGWVEMDESYIKEEMVYSSSTFAYAIGQEITLGSDELFVMGDNRNYSEDSRKNNVGIITMGDVHGGMALNVSMGGFVEWMLKLMYWSW